MRTTDVSSDRRKLNDPRTWVLASSLCALAVASLPSCAKTCDSYTFARDLIQKASSPAEFLSALDRYCGPSQLPEWSGRAVIRSSDGRDLCSLPDGEKQHVLARSKELTFTFEGAWRPPFTTSGLGRHTSAQLMQRRWIGLVDDPQHPTIVQLQIYPYGSPHKLYLVKAGSAPSECALLERFALLAYEEGHVRVHLTAPRFRASTQWQYRSDSVGWAGRLIAFATVDRYGIDRTDLYRGPLVKYGAYWNRQEVSLAIGTGDSWYLVSDTDRLVLMSGRI